jgi:ATP-dependent helicase HrpB
VIAGIRNAALSAASAVHDAELMVAVDGALLGAAGGRRLEVRRASAVELDWLIELDAEGFEDQDLHELDDGGRVRRVRRLIYAGVVVDEEIATSPERLDGQAASRALLAGLPDPPWRACRDHEAVERLRLRLALLGEPDALSEPVVEQALTEACLGMRTIAEVGKLELAAQLCYRLDSGVREALERQVPEYVGLPGRKRVPVRYQPGRDPYIESRLQDFFGLEELPVVAGQPVVAHLLAPNRRAVQVTRDLPRFWQEHYPTLRRSLMRRYPRHAWPEDPSRIGD